MQEPYVGGLSHNCNSEIVNGIRNLASKFKIGNCEACATTIKNYIKSLGGSGQVLEATGEGTMINVSTGKLVGTDSFHQGVRYGNMVYDNIHPNGILYEQWIKDFAVQKVLPDGTNQGGLAVVKTIEEF